MGLGVSLDLIETKVSVLIIVTTLARHENSRRHYRRAWGTIRTEVRNQIDAVHLNGPIFLDFGLKSNFFRQKGPKMVWFYIQKSEFEQNGMR